MPSPHHSVFLQAGCPSCCPTNSVKALKAIVYIAYQYTKLEASGFINQVSGITVQYITHATQAHTHTHLFNGPFSGTTRVSRYQKGKTNLDFTEARDSEWQWHQLGHMQVCTLLHTNNHASTPPLIFLQAGCPSCRPTNSVKALKATHATQAFYKISAVGI